MSNSSSTRNWGTTPWHIEFRPESGALPQQVDFAVVGGGFTGCAAAAWLRNLNAEKSVALFEAETLGAGASGHTGGMALDGAAADNLPGLGNVLEGLSRIHKELGVSCDLTLPGAWELSHKPSEKTSPIVWQDSGELRVAEEVPGGTLDPGKQVSGLAHAAAKRGAAIFEHAPVADIQFSDPLVLEIRGKKVRAGQVLIATNAKSLELGALAGKTQPKFTLAAMTQPLTNEQIESLGLSSGKPFYTVDLPYLWGRLYDGNRLIVGSGLVHPADWCELDSVDVTQGEAANLLERLERRVRGLHPALQEVRFTHRWGGPILIAEQWKPVFHRHPQSGNVIVLGAFSGHGVALSVYLGAWAAEVMLGRRELPKWD